MDQQSVIIDSINLDDIINGDRPISKLFQLLENPLIPNKSQIQQAILFLLQSKHEWAEVRKFALKWRRVKWAGGFLSRMRKRVRQPEQHSLAIDKFEEEFDRLIEKYYAQVDKEPIQILPLKIVKAQKLNLSPVPIKAENRVPPSKQSSKKKQLVEKIALEKRMKQLEEESTENDQFFKRSDLIQPPSKKQNSKQKPKRTSKESKQQNQSEGLFGFLDLNDLQIVDEKEPNRQTVSSKKFKDDYSFTPSPVFGKTNQDQQRKDQNLSLSQNKILISRNASSMKQNDVNLVQLMKSPVPQPQPLPQNSNIKGKSDPILPTSVQDNQWYDVDEEANAILSTFNKEGQLTPQDIKQLTQKTPTFDERIFNNKRKAILGEPLFDKLLKIIVPQKGQSQRDFYKQLQQKYGPKKKVVPTILKRKYNKGLFDDSDEQYRSSFIDQFSEREDIETNGQGIEQEDALAESDKQNQIGEKFKV